MSSIKFQRSSLRQIISVAGSHLSHDFYPAILPALLPAIMEGLSLNLTLAGLLTSMSRLPTLFNPLVGYIADKKGAKYFVILAPAMTATFMSLIGQAASFWSLAGLLFLSGLSSTFFHASSPGVVAQAAAQRKGFGMSLYMAGGGLGRGLGPLVAVWAVGFWGMEGIYRLMFIGWTVSLLLFLQLNKIDFPSPTNNPLRSELPLIKRFFLPLALVLILRAALNASLSTYLPVLLVQSGAPLWIAGAALSILEISGVTGALILGPLSDEIGRERILGLSFIVSSALIPVFLMVNGWLIFPILILVGFFSISSGTIFLALVQDHFQDHRATGNSIYVLLSFSTNALMLILIGFLGDQLGLENAYLISAGMTFCALPALQLVPKVNKNPAV